MQQLNIIIVLVVALLAGCVVTGEFNYTDPKTGATARVGVSKEINKKPKPNFKETKPLLR